jgi:hypothetical protein
MEDDKNLRERNESLTNLSPISSWSPIRVDIPGQIRTFITPSLNSF